MSLKRKFFFSFLLFISALLISEAGLRIVMFFLQGHKFRPVQFLTNHSVYGYAPVPGAQDLKGDYEWNSLGFRNLEFSSQKDKQKFRILCMGGSTTFGTGNPLEHTYPSVLQSLLPRRFEVINAAVSGWSIHQNYLRLKNELLLLKPDAIILENIINAMVYPEPYFRNGHLFTYWFFENFLIFKILDKAVSVSPLSPLHYPLKNQGAEDTGYLETLRRLKEEGPLKFTNKLEDFIKLSQENDIKLVLLIPPLRIDSKYFKTPNRFDFLSLEIRQKVTPLVTQITKKYSVPTIDLRNLFVEEAEMGDLFYDPIHPLPNGNKKIAKEIESKVLTLFP